MIHGLDKRLQKLRTERKLSQKEVATAIGISTSLLSNYESCERTPSVENLISLASFYRCTTDYLLGIDKGVAEHTLNISTLTDEQRYLLKAFIDTLQ